MAGSSSASEPIAAQRGISAGEDLTIRGGLTLDVNASGYAGRRLELRNPQLKANGNRIETSTSARCVDKTSLGFCADGKAVEQVDLKTVVRPDMQALIKNNTPAGTPATLNRSVTINSAQELNNFLITMGQFGRVNGNVTFNVPVILSGVKIAAAGEIEFRKGAKLSNTTLIAEAIGFNGIDLQGKNVLLARSDIRLDGQISSGGSISQIVAGDGIRVAKTGVGQLSAVLWSGEDVEIEGKLNLFGGVLAGESFSLDDQGVLRVSVTSPADRLQAGLGGGDKLAAFFDSADPAAIRALLAEYGLKYSGGQVQIFSATDCAESTYQNPRIVSSAGSAVTPGAGFGTYFVDSLGRPYQGVKTVDKPAFATARTTAVNNCSAAVGKIESPTGAAGTDQGGHMVGLQYGGWGLRLNLAPQYASFNTGNWLQLENGIVKCGNLTGTKTATATISVAFPNTTTNRPSTWTASIAVTGASTISGTFQNADLGGANGTATRTSMVNSLVAAGCQ